MKNKKTLVAAQMGYSVYPQWSFGLMVGQTYRGIGWYVNGRTNFKGGKDTRLGISSSNDYFLTGDKHSSYYVVNAGVMLDFMALSGKMKNRFNTIGMYVGVGYGERELFYKSTSSEWYDYLPNCVDGVSVNLGLFGSVKRVTFSVGLNTIGFKYLDMDFGLGIMF